MQAQTHAAASTTPVLIANGLGVLAGLVLLAVLTNVNLLVVGGDAPAFYALVLVGMGMCVLGGVSRAPATLGWTHPVTINGAVLGIAILVLVMAFTFGWIAVLEPVALAIGISTERAAVILLGLLLAAKWAIGLAYLR